VGFARSGGFHGSNSHDRWRRRPVSGAARDHSVKEGEEDHFLRRGDIALRSRFSFWPALESDVGFRCGQQHNQGGLSEGKSAFSFLRAGRSEFQESWSMRNS